MLYLVYYFIIGTIVIKLAWRGVIRYLTSDDIRDMIFRDPFLMAIQNWIKPLVFIILVCIWPAYLISLIKEWICGIISGIRILRAVRRINKILMENNLEHLTFKMEKK